MRNKKEVTAKMVAANRENAKRSPGPKTDLAVRPERHQTWPVSCVRLLIDFVAAAPRSIRSFATEG
jgi:hypothetical protein